VQLYCHCDDCQSAHGAAYVPAAYGAPAAPDGSRWGRVTGSFFHAIVEG
jgi:hypothetical protein